MSEVTEYAQGTPCWVDLSTPDIEAAKEFYRTLFDWDYVVGPPETGGYTQAMLRGEIVAGLMQAMSEQEQPHAYWTTYLAATDADAIQKAIVDNGGQPLMDVMDVMGAGRMTVATDPTGVRFGVWQPGQHRGALIVNEPGAVIWNDLATPDADRARDFYGTVFGVETGRTQEGADYTMINAEGRDVGGIFTADGVEPAWNVYFAVADTDATIRTAQGLGATVVREPVDTPYGRMATMRDPQGAAFSLASVA
ncbi:MAG: VOC family protein [Kutzneria sp.]|nr:VOC family protein [Kutzneria sp.]